MNKEPLISIVVPIFNIEKCLTQCIDSILNQTYSNLEIILVDDGSTDTCPTICDSYAQKDKRVVVIHKKNGGLSSAREAGIMSATGDYLMIVDGDDWIDLNTINTCVKEIVNNPELELVMFSYVKELPNRSIEMNIMDESAHFSGQEVIDKIHRRLFGLSDDELNHPERMENIVTCWAKLYRIDVAKRGKYYAVKEVGSCEDGLFNIYALHGCKNILYINEHLYHYRKDEKSITGSYRPQFVQQWGNLFSIMEGIIEEKNLGEEYKKALSNRIALSITAVGLNEIRNPSNKTWGHIKVLKEYLKQEKYHNAVSKLKIKNMPLPWKLLMLSCKIKCATAVYVAIAMIERLRSR